MSTLGPMLCGTSKYQGRHRTHELNKMSPPHSQSSPVEYVVKRVALRLQFPLPIIIYSSVPYCVLSLDAQKKGRIQGRSAREFNLIQLKKQQK